MVKAKIIENPDPIDYLCDSCFEEAGDCYDCDESMEEGDTVYCIDDEEGQPIHICKKCLKNRKGEV